MGRRIMIDEQAIPAEQQRPDTHRRCALVHTDTKHVQRPPVHLVTTAAHPIVGAEEQRYKHRNIVARSYDITAAANQTCGRENRADSSDPIPNPLIVRKSQAIEIPDLNHRDPAQPDKGIASAKFLRANSKQHVKYPRENLPA